MENEANLFSSIPLNESQALVVTRLKSQATDLLKTIREINSPEYTETARYHLEASVMFAVKAVSREIR